MIDWADVVYTATGHAVALLSAKKMEISIYFASEAMRSQGKHALFLPPRATECFKLGPEIIRTYIDIRRNHLPLNNMFTNEAYDGGEYLTWCLT